MIKGIDYSWGRPGGKAIAEAGYQFVVRYLPYPGSGGKEITRAEIADLHAHKVAIAFVYESTANRPLGGPAAGLADGRQALDSMRALGVPDNIPVYFAVDFDAAETEQAAIDAYLRGCAGVIGASRVGVYGGYHVVKRCRDNGTAVWFWQTYAWSGGLKLPERHIYQYLNDQRLNGVPVDHNEARGGDFGQWPKSFESGESAPALTAEQINEALQLRWALQRLAIDPELWKVKRAHDALRERGLL